MYICDECMKKQNVWSLPDSFIKCGVCGIVKPCAFLPGFNIFEQKQENETEIHFFDEAKLPDNLDQIFRSIGNSIGVNLKDVFDKSKLKQSILKGMPVDGAMLIKKNPDGSVELANEVQFKQSEIEDECTLENPCNICQVSNSLLSAMGLITQEPVQTQDSDGNTVIEHSYVSEEYEAEEFEFHRIVENEGPSEIRTALFNMVNTLLCCIEDSHDVDNGHVGCEICDTYRITKLEIAPFVKESEVKESENFVHLVTVKVKDRESYATYLCDPKENDGRIYKNPNSWAYEEVSANCPECRKLVRVKIR